jgi:hypothetical protein
VGAVIAGFNTIEGNPERVRYLKSVSRFLTIHGNDLPPRVYRTLHRWVNSQVKANVVIDPATGKAMKGNLASGVNDAIVGASVGRGGKGTKKKPIKIFIDVKTQGAKKISALVSKVTVAKGTLSIIFGVIDAQINALRNKMVGTNWFTYGYNVGSAWAGGLVRALWDLYDGSLETASLQSALDAIARKIQGTSPPKEGPLKHIDRGGYNIGKAWGEGLGKGMVRNIRTHALSAKREMMMASADARQSFGGVEASFNNKRTIEIKMDVSSKDGSVDRVKQSEMRRGIMDALVMADIEHFVMVG